ncbi:metal-dependent hydrolase [Ottowia sp.]|uniref:metal-dependent hydrolase n=1 Tax=Ottowia sp. TaxID=1898956 RepID=UPI002B697B9E|nr:hypothetical protein [Pseudomonadota bacterium]HOV19093.1 hypothetical protein [Ottowia sp.]
MPFTPIHLGPGLAFKALGGRHFSFMVFGGAQVLMDLEPLIGILQDRDVLHGVTHTGLGALVIGSVAAVIGKPISTMVLRWRKIAHPPLTWLAAMTGAYVGTFSHVLLDAIMHADMAPAWPLLRGNPMLDLIGIDPLHLACLVAGVVGLPMALMRAKAQARSSG